MRIPSAIVGVGLAAVLSFASAMAAMPEPDATPLTHLSFAPSLQTGFRDRNGKRVAGTEVMHLVPHQGRLYASTSLWMEKDPAVPKACQVLVLDSPDGPWRVERQFNNNHLRYGSLRTVTFATDAQGNAIGAVTLLLAAPDVIRGPVRVFCREDDTGEWSSSVLGTVASYTTTRSIGLHRDAVTKVDRIFAGTDKLGVIAGSYAPAEPGRIRWEKTAELATPAGERVMGFCECNGVLYCATSRHIFRRVDGATPSWQQIYFCEKETSPSGIRGLSSVPNPNGRGEVLWFTALSRVRRLDPAKNNEETVELDLPSFLTKQLGIRVTYVLSAYNELTPVTMPRTGERVWVFGFECAHPAAAVNANPDVKARVLVKEVPKRVYFSGAARFCIRRDQGGRITYEVGEITNPKQPLLVATRAIAVSPFPADQGKAFYLGGFDCNSVPSHDTGWVYRAELEPVRR